MHTGYAYQPRALGYVQRTVATQVETEPAHVAFDLEHGGLEQALSSGVLPARFFGPAKTGSKRVKQTIPAGEHDAIMFDSRADEVY